MVLPNQRHMEWYRRGKTAFLHFTVNTFTDKEWGDGTEKPEIFAPEQLDCRQWARVLKEAGFTAAILTAKHHDGFCLWPSRYTEHSVKNSPGSPDVVGMFTQACREFGIKAGLYLSPWDRNHPMWGTEAYNDYYTNQLAELMTQYGPIWECWWDGAGSTQARYDWKRWADIVRQYQPDCVIFGCLGAAEYVDVRWVGNECGQAGENCWATIDPVSVMVENCQELNSGKPEGSHFIPAETNTSIRPGWFYHASQDGQVKKVEELVDYWFHSAGRNTAILLNLPPDRRGLVHEADARSVIAWNKRMEAIFQTNLAEGAAVTAGAENLLNGDEKLHFAAAEQNPEVVFTFPESVTFDCYRVDEVIELGQRVRDFALDIWQDGKWQTIARRQCMGFCRCERFAPVTTNRVRLRILDAVAEPVLRFFGLYCGAYVPEEKQAAEPRELTGLQIQRNGREMVIGLGGIYPYNAVELEVPELEIQAFNGTRYERVYEGNGGLCRFRDVEGSYQLKILAAREIPEEVSPRVFWME